MCAFLYPEAQAKSQGMNPFENFITLEISGNWSCEFAGYKKWKGNFVKKGPHPSNSPPALSGSGMVVDSQENLYLFGGEQRGSSDMRVQVDIL